MEKDKLKTKMNNFTRLAVKTLMAGSLFLIAPNFVNTIKNTDQMQRVSAEANTIEVTPINPKFFFEGELTPTSNRDGMFKYGGKYLPAAVQYENAIYVPIDFLTKKQNYSLIYDGGDIWLNAPTDEFSIGKDVPELPMGHYESDGKIKAIIYEDDFKENSSTYGVNIEDLKFFNISPYEDADSAIEKLTFKNQKILNSGNDIFVTDSVGTDTSIFMSIEKNNNNEITRIDYEDFSMKFEKINQKYKYSQPSFKSSRGIVIGSKMSDVLSRYGDNPTINIGEVDHETDKNGNKTKNNLINAFQPSLNDSEISVDMRQKAIPKSAAQNKLLYLTITYEFDGYNSGYLSYHAVVSKNEPMTNAVIYGFDYNLN